MRFHLLNTVIIVCGLLDPARTLQIFNGTLTEIICSAAKPVYRLINQERVYNSYAELPDLFDIEARPSPTGNNVTLYINGTNRSNNVTVICGHVDVDVSSGIPNPQFQILFTLILEFVGILPAPNDVHYTEDPPGYLQILWRPPTLDSDELDSQNITIKRYARIIHYTIYIITEESTIVQVYNASGTSFYFENGSISESCSFWFQVAAVNPAGVGECSPPQILAFDSLTGCMDSTISTTDIIIESSSGLSAGEIAAVIVGIVLIIVGVSIIMVLAIVFTLKLKNDRHQRVKQSLKSLRSDQLLDTKDSVAEIEKCVKSDHSNSGNDHDTVDDNNQPSDSTLTRTYSHDGPPVCSYLYAEIDVVAKRKNKVPEPSSTEDTDHHVYAVLEQSSNQIQITNTDMNDIDQDDGHPKPDSQD